MSPHGRVVVVVVVGRGLVVVVGAGGGAWVVVVTTGAVVVVVVVVVVLEEEDGADDEVDDTVSDGMFVSVGINEGVLISDTRAGSSVPGPAGSPEASDPTCGAST